MNIPKNGIKKIILFKIAVKKKKKRRRYLEINNPGSKRLVHWKIQNVAKEIKEDKKWKDICVYGLEDLIILKTTLLEW